MRGFDFIGKAANFMDCVAANELDIRLNPQGFFPPGYTRDLWDERFNDAYSELRRFIKPIQKDRLFFPPPGLRYVNKPFVATSAVEALMFFLNPKESLYGEAGVLEKSQYVVIKIEAMDEIARIQKRRNQNPRLKKKVLEAAVLRSLLLDHHFASPSKVNIKTLMTQDIERALNWSQAKVSRQMTFLFNAKIGGGFKAYHAMFGTADTPQGFRKMFDDGTVDVDGLWIDRLSSDE